MNLPDHLKTEVRWWLEYLASVDRLPNQATYEDAAMFALRVLAAKSLTTRVSCINALAEYHRDYVGGVNPFKVNPWPYPVLTRFLPKTFQDCWESIVADNGCRWPAALVLVCRASLDEVVGWDGSLRNGCVLVGGRCVPVPEKVREILAEWSPITKAEAKQAILRFGAVVDLHGALSEELIRRGVPEITRATIYGRWSAMRYQVATKRSGFFRLGVPPTRGLLEKPI